MNRRGRLAATAALLLALGAGACAPPPRPGASVDDLAARYRAARDQREAILNALTADVVVRLDGRAIGRTPALSAALSFAAPDRARLVASLLIGVAVDACARGDSVVVWIPSQRTAFVVGGAAESLAIGPPLALFARAVGATWDPPHSAWGAATADSAGLHVAWSAGADSLTLLVGGDGLPVAVQVTRSGESVRVSYGAWTRVRGEPWPSRVELADARARLRLRLEVRDASAPRHVDEHWFAQHIPADARRLDWSALRAMLSEDGAIR